MGIFPIESAASHSTAQYLFLCPANAHETFNVGCGRLATDRVAGCSMLFAVCLFLGDVTNFIVQQTLERIVSVFRYRCSSTCSVKVRETPRLNLRLQTGSNCADLCLLQLHMSVHLCSSLLDSCLCPQLFCQHASLSELFVISSVMAD